MGLIGRTNLFTFDFGKQSLVSLLKATCMAE